MNPQLLRGLRNRRFQRIWDALHRRSLIGMNFWSSEFHHTGELDALRYVARQLQSVANPVIFDVGANVGDYSKMCARLLGENCRVHAFEPSAVTFERLQDSVSGEKQIVAHNLALSDSEGMATLYTPGDGSTLASLHPLDPLDQAPKAEREGIRMTTLDGFCTDQGIEHIHFLKIDVEGHELAVLRGAEQHLEHGLIRFIQFEFGENSIGARSYLRDFVDLLGDAYAMYKVVPGGLVPFHYRGGASEIFATMNYFCELRQLR